jgi:hypothetical protein
MKTNMKKGLIWLGLSILMTIFWIVGLIIGNAIFPSSITEMSADSDSSGGLILLLICALNTLVVLYFIYNSQCKGWKLVGTIFLITFGLQYFMSQIETLWFNESINSPIKGILAVVSGGFIMNLLFSVTATWFTGNFSLLKKSAGEKTKVELAPIVKYFLLLSIVVWPVIYFLAGYFIAWQFAEVRLFYSGTVEMDSFLSMMKANVASGLYFFQILRGVLWILIALPALAVIRGSLMRKGVIIGLLFAVLSGSQLLLPNPFMSDMVRMAHIIETAPSNFLWGFIIAWCFGKLISSEPK